MGDYILIAKWNPYTVKYAGYCFFK